MLKSASLCGQNCLFPWQNPPTRSHAVLHDSPDSPTNHSGVVVGDLEGNNVGLVEGAAVGLIDGLADGASVGSVVGDTVGDLVGLSVSRAPLHGQMRRAVARCAASGDAGGAAPQHSRSCSSSLHRLCALWYQVHTPPRRPVGSSGS